jgi:microcystin-dependent protein
MTIIAVLPYDVQNGTTNDASQVMANFNQIMDGVNSNAAENGVNTSITQLTGITTPLSVSQGGTGAATLSANKLIVGAGASVNSISNGTAGQVLTSNGALADPSFQTITTVPTGLMSMWAASTAPSGWLECNGASLSTTTYAALFAIIAYTYGGSGANFNLPDMRGYFPRGWDNGRGVDSGRAIGTSQADDNKSHTHTATVTDPGHVHTSSKMVNNGGGNGGAGASLGWVDTASAVTGISVSNSTVGTEARPKNVALMFIIKA